ncbi:hypothetical protein [Caballeronia sp. 15711]|uniref:hypothetical protein n=1 Tax=Caballeronia sp. 15711 TaxID=3391029 RepID=UPI0039E27BC4
MVRQVTGGEVLGRAKKLIVEAATVDELRQAQAVLLPLEFGQSEDRITEESVSSTRRK